MTVLPKGPHPTQLEQLKPLRKMYGRGLLADYRVIVETNTLEEKRIMPVFDTASQLWANQPKAAYFRDRTIHQRRRYVKRLFRVVPVDHARGL